MDRVEATGAEPTGAEPASDNPFAAMDPEMAANPQPVFRLMRETMPVVPIEGVGVALSRKADIDAALRQPGIFSSNIDAVDLGNIRPLIPLQIDPPDQKKYRKLLDPIFAPRQVALLEESITRLVNDLIDRIIGHDAIDFATSFSIPFPSQVFLTLLGLPLDELPTFLTMKDGIIRPDAVTGEPYGSQAMREYQRGVADSVYAYFDQILDRREERRQDDLLSRLLDAEVEGAKLSREEILDICFLFLIAGLDTVTATLDCMFAFLARHPQHRRDLVADPALIPGAVEELLRWETPVMGVVRVATEDTEVAGCPVAKGQTVSMLLGSANTDEAEFDEADVVHFDREVNRHLAFGGGVHRCLGSNLARLELRIALREWHRRIPEYSVAEGHTLVYTAGIRSIEHFPMVLSVAR